MSKGNTTENDVLEHLFKATALSWAANANLYIALHTGDPGEAGSANEIGAGVGYARQSAAFTSNGDGTVDNDALITFGPNTNTNWGSVTHVSVWTAASGGSCLYKGPLTAAKTVNIGDSLDIAAAALVVGET